MKSKASPVPQKPVLLKKRTASLPPNKRVTLLAEALNDLKTHFESASAMARRFTENDLRGIPPEPLNELQVSKLSQCANAMATLISLFDFLQSNERLHPGSDLPESIALVFKTMPTPPARETNIAA